MKILFLISLICQTHPFVIAQNNIDNSFEERYIMDSWYYSHVYSGIRKYKIILPAGDDYSNDNIGMDICFLQ